MELVIAYMNEATAKLLFDRPVSMRTRRRARRVENRLRKITCLYVGRINNAETRQALIAELEAAFHKRGGRIIQQNYFFGSSSTAT